MHHTLAKLMAFVLLCSCFVSACADTAAIEIKFLDSTKGVFVAEIASDEESRAKGLMHRTYLPACGGMWFNFGSPRVVAMWMKDTLISLDIIFIGGDFRVLAIFANANPLSESLIVSPPSTQYVLEINAGEARENNLVVGQQVTIGPRGSLTSLMSRLKCSQTKL